MPKFWMNYLIVLRVFGFMFYIIQNPEMTENWLPEGFICLLPMSEDTNNPKNYRPITCFTTRYKILTSMRTERMYVYLERNYILSQEQNGCKYQLQINKMILEIFRTKNYKKKKHPHMTGFLKPWTCRKSPPIISNSFRNSMPMWKTHIAFNQNNDMSKSVVIIIKRRILQGDSLSPLLFCMALIPPSKELNKTEYAYKIFNRAMLSFLHGRLENVCIEWRRF